MIGLPDDLLAKVGHSTNATFALESSLGWLREAGYRVVKLRSEYVHPKGEGRYTYDGAGNRVENIERHLYRILEELS